jgi:hypothetical protein
MRRLVARCQEQGTRKQAEESALHKQALRVSCQHLRGRFDKLGEKMRNNNWIDKTWIAKKLWTKLTNDQT